MIHIGLVYWYSYNLGKVDKTFFLNDFIENHYTNIKAHRFHRSKSFMNFHEGAYWMILK